MSRLERRIAALEARISTLPPEDRTRGIFFNPEDEERDASVIHNGYGREWRRQEGETPAEFRERVKDEARSERPGLGGAYDRMLTVVD